MLTFSMMRYLIFITVVLVHQLHVRQVFGDISEENWFTNGSQTCKKFVNQTNLATNAAINSSLHLNATFYYLTNVSDLTQNLNFFMFNKNNESTEKDLFLDIKLDFRNNFNDLNYTLKTFPEEVSDKHGVVPLPRLRNNVELGIDLNIYLDLMSRTITILLSTKSGKYRNKSPLFEHYFSISHNVSWKNLIGNVWVSYITNTCSYKSITLQNEELTR